MSTYFWICMAMFAAGVILLGIVIYILAVTGEHSKAKRAKLEQQMLAEETEQTQQPEVTEEIQEETAQAVATE